MSYDIYFEVDTGAGHTAEVAWRNHTTNCSPMWSLALASAGWQRTLGDLIEATPSAAALAEVVRPAVTYMRTHPDEFRPLAPANGWGSYESGLDYLTWVADMCTVHPRCTVRVSR